MPRKSLGALDAEAAGAVIAAAADIALVIDKRGIIRDVAFGSDELAADLPATFVGKRWADVVTVESREKLESMLREAQAGGQPRGRQVNYSVAKGSGVPILHTVMTAGKEGRVVAVGRDLRALETLQQQLLDVQQSMEREYSRLRHAETRYRLLFQLASEALLVVDAATSKVIEANPAAAEILGATSRRLLGQSFPQGFDADSTRAVQALLATAKATGRAAEVRVRLNATQRQFLMAASLFRHDDAAHVLVQMRSADGAGMADGAGQPHSKLLEVIERSPDGLVVTDEAGMILTANAAFLELAQLATPEQARGQPLDRWLGRPGVDVRVLAANVRQHGSVRLFATVMRGQYGGQTPVEVAAVAAVNGEEPCLGFAVRNVENRAGPPARRSGELPRSMQELSDLIGHVPLKELVRETTDVIERMCIEAALELTGDNRATAAEMLGLSRQSLYAKLRRYGLGDLESPAD